VIRLKTSCGNAWKNWGSISLQPREQEAIALYWLFGDVMNGGFHQYFFNSSGDMAPLAVQGKRRIF
jgi:hypothetical protein